MAYLSMPKIFRHLTFLHLSSPFIVDNCSHISNLSFAITYLFSNIWFIITYLSIQRQSPFPGNVVLGKTLSGKGLLEGNVADPCH